MKADWCPVEPFQFSEQQERRLCDVLWGLWRTVATSQTEIQAQHRSLRRSNGRVLLGIIQVTEVIHIRLSFGLCVDITTTGVPFLRKTTEYCFIRLSYGVDIGDTCLGFYLVLDRERTSVVSRTAGALFIYFHPWNILSPPLWEQETVSRSFAKSFWCAPKTLWF